MLILNWAMIVNWKKVDVFIIVMHYGIEVEHIVVCFLFFKGGKETKNQCFLNRTVEMESCFDYEYDCTYLFELRNFGKFKCWNIEQFDTQ